MFIKLTFAYMITFVLYYKNKASQNIFKVQQRTIIRTFTHITTVQCIIQTHNLCVVIK